MCLNCSQCSDQEFETAPCTLTKDRTCELCTSLPVCDEHMYRRCGHGYKSEACMACEKCASGHYRVGCGGLSAGYCAPCQDDCGLGRHRIGCGSEEGLWSSGVCEVCGTCGDEQYRKGCSFLSPGSCEECQDCGKGNYLQGCGGTAEGVCKDCVVCGMKDYMSEACSASKGGECAPCAGLEDCGKGMYRQGMIIITACMHVRSQAQRVCPHP